MKKRLFAFALLLLLLAGAVGASADISFVDDDGKAIALNAPATRIISLYSGHTECLYALGAGDKLIGAHSTSTFPPEAAFLPRYDYNGDPEVIIAAAPDLVLVRPFISRRVPALIEALERAGITVVSLYADAFDEFDEYIDKLSQLVGAEDVAKEKLAAFHAELDEIEEMTRPVAGTQRIFFESTETDLRTVTPDSMPGIAIAIAGGASIAEGATATTESSSIAPFGAERILERADDIDVYVSQRGAMNAGGNEHSIRIRPGFDAIKAVKDDRIHLINEKIISSPTFRYTIGVREIARFLYPALMDDVSMYATDDPATKRDLAVIMMKARHLPVFVPSSSKYYETETKGHIYGLFEDVSWQDPDFDAVEACVGAGYIPWAASEDDRQYYEPDAPVTREMLARAVFIMGDFKAADEPVPIADLMDCEKPALVQKLVDSGVFPLNEGGEFEPGRPVTCREIADVLTSF